MVFQTERHAATAPPAPAVPPAESALRPEVFWDPPALSRHRPWSLQKDMADDGEWGRKFRAHFLIVAVALASGMVGCLWLDIHVLDVLVLILDGLLNSIDGAGDFIGVGFRIELGLHR